MKRRSFLETTVVASIAATVSPSAFAFGKRAPRILLRSSWQTVYIGDIAHTPGVLAILEKHFPEAEIRLWPSHVGNGVEEMLLARFPKLKIVKDNASLTAALTECDFLLHGSGPSMVAEKDVVRWSKETGKPYGIFGITFSITTSTATKPASDSALASTIQVFNGAKFVFFRDSVSLELARTKGCTWRDIGLGNWLFDFDSDDERKALPNAVLAMAKDFSTAKATAAKGREFVEQRQRDMVSVLKMVL